MMGGPCSVQVVSAGCGSSPSPTPSVFCQGSPQMLMTSGLVGSLISKSPNDPLVPAFGVVRHQGDLAIEIHAEAVRAAARHVIETQLARLRGVADIENVKARSRRSPGFVREPLRIDVQDVFAGIAELVHMHAGRRLEFEHLPRLARIAHVVDREALGLVRIRPADGADEGVPVDDLDQTAAAESRRRIVTEQTKVLCFFRIHSVPAADREIGALTGEP